MGMVKCPCEQAKQIDENSKICDFCGKLLAKNWSQTRALDNADDEDTMARFGTSFFNGRMMLNLRLRDVDKTFTIDAELLTDVIMGRSDTSTGEKPTIDLTTYGGDTMGVSRRHARITRREDNALHLVDLKSANGTYLNGQKLIPDQARILRNGDEIRLGKLVMSVEFTRRSLPGTMPIDPPVPPAARKNGKDE